MLRLFVDTCVWRHWFKFCAGASTPDNIKQHCESFQRIYALVESKPPQARFLYNQLIKDELGEPFESDFDAKVIPLSEKIPIPLSRLDSGFHFDSGDLLLGGNMGGSLRELLFMDGYQQDKKLEHAAALLRENEFLFDTKPRKREFDIEHMESALAAEADLFLTNDESTILARLERASSKFKKNHAINMIFQIAKTPTSALSYVESYLNASPILL